LADLQRTVYPHTGHPSAEGRAQDRVSSPTKDRRSANCATQPTQLRADNAKMFLSLVSFFEFYESASVCLFLVHVFNVLVCLLIGLVA